MPTQELVNPYFELLGIPESDFPPNRYRLLGIPSFTANENVIRNGADRQMQFLRRVGGEKYLDDVQTILNEVAEAKIFLLNEEKRIPYDHQLRGDESSRSSQSGLQLDSSSASVFLIMLDGDLIGQTLSFDRDRVSIGPQTDADLRLPHLSTSFVIQRKKTQWFVESRSNTFALNHAIVEERSILKSGDIIRFSLHGDSVQFQIGDAKEQVSYWVEKFPHCRVDPLPEILPGPKWKQKPAINAAAETRAKSNVGFVKKTDTGFSFATIIFCIVVGCAIGAALFYLIIKTF